MKKSKKKWSVCLLTCLLLLSGCARMTQADIQFTTGLAEHELFKIGQEVCAAGQAMVLVASRRNTFERVYGDGIWKVPVNGSSFEAVVLDSMKILLAQMKCMTLMAGEYEVVLPESEKRRLREAVSEYCRLAGEKDLEAAGVTEDDVWQAFYEYRLSFWLITELTKNVNVEISDNEARVMQIQQIFLKTAGNGQGSASVSPQEKQNKYRQMADIRQRIEDGEEFSRLAEFGDAGQPAQLSLRRGEMPQAYEDVVFALEDGEVSDIIETSQGYYLVKCLEDYDMEATQIHKDQMSAVKKKEAFSQLYDTFTAGLTSEFNQEAWDRLSMSETAKIPGADFFDIYRDYFGEQ